MKDDDLLKTLAPADITLTGQVISIPTNNNEDKTKFFLNVKTASLKNKTYQTKSKTFVTIQDTKDNYQKIKIGDEIKIYAKLRTPQTNANPSQFSYRNYLKNFNTFTTAYVAPNSWEIQNEPNTLKWKFIQNLNILRQKIIAKHNNVLAIISGHFHTNSESMENGVYHISTPSLLTRPQSYKVIDIVTTKEFSPIIYTQLREFTVMQETF